MIGIYKTILKSTGRVVYVGQTTHPELLGKRYFGGGMNIKKYSRPEQRKMFVTEIITTTESQDEANELERYYIEYFCTLEEYGGFNIGKGGLGHDGWFAKNRKDLSKPVLQFAKDGTFIAEYPSAHEAWRQTGVSQGNISFCCNGHRKFAGGFIWRQK